MKDAEEENEEKSGAIGLMPKFVLRYVRNLMGHITTHLVEISAKNDLKRVAEQPDIILSLLAVGTNRGAAECIGTSNLECSAVIYLLLKFVVEWVEGQITYLEAQETTAVIDYCMRLLQLYSSHNIGKVVFYGLHIVTPRYLWSSLKYPKLCRDVSRVIHIIQEMDLGLAKDVQVH
ncbi:hypothetical protein NL676_010797 [Syzygium grande]|nr:hypothetical protein NL676_010797 [Syzygium grande]